ncbi:hypothetical protein D0S45_08870 [Marinifilum sp. JC120]|nr:hypothetical protein D0S45_08870 [Marinifilum sp. JC120]
MEKLLIVSDNPKAVRSLSVLFQHDYCVLTAKCDLDSILATTNNNTPDKVIFEFHEYSAVKDVLGKLKKSFYEADIVVVCSVLSTEDRVDIKLKIQTDSIFTKPCSKSDIVNSLNNNKKKHMQFESMFEKSCIKKSISDSSNDLSIQKPKIDRRIMYPILEAYEGKNVVLYRCYSRVSDAIHRMSCYFSFDFEYVHELLAYYLSIIATLDEHLITNQLSGEHTEKRVIPLLVDQIEKVKSSAQARLNHFDTTPLTDMIYINKKFNGEGLPEDNIAGDRLPFAARVLRLLFDFHYLQETGKSIGESVYILSMRLGWYDRDILVKFQMALGEEATSYCREIFPLGLLAGMVMAQDLYVTIDGKEVVLIKDGQTLSEQKAYYIQRHAQDIFDITEPVKIRESIVLYEECNA